MELRKENGADAKGTRPGHKFLCL